MDGHDVFSKETVLAALPIKTYYEKELPSIRWNGNGGKARCPFHDDRSPSLSIDLKKKGFVKCFGCGFRGDIFSFHRKKHALLYPEALKDLAAFAGVSISKNGNRGRRGIDKPSENTATAQQETQRPSNMNESCNMSGNKPCNDAATGGITLKEYAEAKRLDIKFLKGLGLSDITYNEAPAIRIPYYDPEGNELSVRIRTALNKSPDGQDNRFKWKKGSKPYLYGLQHRFNHEYRIFVEGESDCHALWYHGFPALGIAGATNWNDDRDAHHLNGIENIYIVIEPDSGGEALRKIIANSTIKERAKIVSLNGFKDSSALHLDNPEAFKQRMQDALDQATPWVDIERERDDHVRTALWNKCKELALQPDILSAFIHDLHSLGVEGEDIVSKTLFLSVVSRYLDRPVSDIIKGQSSGGKSFVVQETLRFFPQSAYFSMTDMSAKVLAFTDEPLKHRFIVLYEAVGLSGGKNKENESDDQTKNYFIRSLLSEGCIDYYITVKTKNGFEGRKIHKDGPTGLILTTTKVALHPENETRYLSFTINDTPEQTKNVLLAIARKEDNTDSINVDFALWLSLHEWLNLANHKVSIPYVRRLAEEIPPVAVRLRRDFTLLLHLIKAHAILHQATRHTDSQGRIIATLTDYTIVRQLVSNVMSDGVGATVDKRVREVVNAVAEIIDEGNDHATMQQLVDRLKLHKSTISRRVLLALSGGYLVNTDNKNRKPYKLTIGEPLPDETELLPPPEKIECCTDACFSNESTSPPPPTITADFIHEDDDPPEPPRFKGGRV